MLTLHSSDSAGVVYLGSRTQGGGGGWGRGVEEGGKRKVKGRMEGGEKYSEKEWREKEGEGKKVRNKWRGSE